MPDRPYRRCTIVTHIHAGMRVKSSSSSFLRDSRGSGILPSRRNGERSIYLHIFLVTYHLRTGNGTGPAALSSWYESTTCTDLLLRLRLVGPDGTTEVYRAYRTAYEEADYKNVHLRS